MSWRNNHTLRRSTFLSRCFWPWNILGTAYHRAEHPRCADGDVLEVCVCVCVCVAAWTRPMLASYTESPGRSWWELQNAGEFEKTKNIKLGQSRKCRPRGRLPWCLLFSGWTWRVCVSFTTVPPHSSRAVGRLQSWRAEGLSQEIIERWGSSEMCWLGEREITLSGFHGDTAGMSEHALGVAPRSRNVHPTRGHATGRERADPNQILEDPH